MIYLFGDLHGVNNVDSKFNKNSFPEGQNLSKSDYVIILGDFGIPWYFPETIEYQKEMKMLEILNNKKWTTLFIDGNHENFVNLNNLPQIDMLDGKVGKLSENIYHLKRGYIYTIENKKFFVFGGGVSIDKSIRTDRVSWWEEEECTISECDFAIQNLEKENFTVDYVLTHTASYRLSEMILNRPREFIFRDSNSKFFEYLEKEIHFKRWFFGHFHLEYKNFKENFFSLYEHYCKLDTIKDEIEFKIPFANKAIIHYGDIFDYLNIET